ncbi:MAG: tetratricopeptide repeat protein [Burkholderiaceae bacterium]|jgi:hypothetical protein|nr:tetratricopeptide repeat protein [Burkholderiaceae bacterium]MEB2351478.1 tetratricopeptide repeat protein [Burkholderiaceae bacterium]
MKNDAARYLAMSSVCAVALITGCATAPGLVPLDSRNTKIEPLYRIEQPAGTAAGQYAVGRMHLAEGRVDAAMTRFRNALTLEPGYVEALNGLGVAYGQKGRYEEAVQAFRTALAATPDSARLLNNLGFAQFKAGRLQEASVSLDRALGLEPHDLRTRENVRQLAEARERAAPAQAALTMKPDEPVGAPQVTAVVPARADDAAPAPVQVRPVEVVAANGPVPVPRTEPARSANFEVVLAKSNDSMLVQVAPAVYEIRPISAAQQVAPGSAAVPVAPAVEPRPVPTRTSLAAIDRLEVSNGAGTNRLATRTARRLAQMGATVARVTNHPGFGRQRTEIHYRDGHPESAKWLGARLPVDAKLVNVDGLRGDVDVRLVVGRDMAQSDVAAWWNEALDVARSAEPEPGAGTAPEPVTRIDPAVIVAPLAVDSQPDTGSIARVDAEGGWRHL